MDLITPSINGRTDRDDATVRELFLAGNLKQALANQEKQHKKNPKDYRLANKILILLHMSDSPERQSQGHQELQDLISRNYPIGDLDVLELLDSLSEERGLMREAVGMWERAIATSSNKGKLSEVWFERKVLAGHWKYASKAVLSAFKHTANRRRYFFGRVLCNYLYSQAVPEAPTEEVTKEMNLSRNLAYGLLSKAVIDTRKDDGLIEAVASTKNEKAPPKRLDEEIDPSSLKLQTSLDIEFLIKVYTDQGKDQEALAVLEDDQRTGIVSILGKGSWELIRCKIELLEKCAKWHDLYSLCIELINDATRALLKTPPCELRMPFGAIGDDWLVWKALIRATSRIRNEVEIKDAHRAILAYKEINIRHHCLGLLEWWLQDLPNITDTEARIMGLPVELFAGLFTKPSAIRDISKYVGSLSGRERITFVHQAAGIVTETFGKPAQQAKSASDLKLPRQWIYAEINSLKLDYTLVVSCQNGTEGSFLMETFVANCLRLWEVSLTLDQADHTLTDRRVGDDAAILAAIGCIRLYHEQRKEALLRAILILEELIFHSPHNYEAQLLLIRVYVYQGAVTKASGHYNRLDIKNVQHYSLSWVLFTRISTIHPLSSRVHRFDAGEELDSVRRSMDRVRMSVKSSVIQYLETGAYRNLLGQLQVSKFCQKSISKSILRLEEWRVACVRGAEKPEIVESDTIYAGDWIFTRDTLGFPNYEPLGQPSIEKYVSAGPLPEKSWIGLQILLGNLRLSLGGTGDPSLEAAYKMFAERGLHHLMEELESDTSMGLNHKDHTTAERKMREFASTIFTIITACLSLNKSRSTTILDISRVDTTSPSDKAKIVRDEENLAAIAKQTLNVVERSLEALTQICQGWFLSGELLGWMIENIKRPPGLMQWTFFHDLHVQIEAMSVYMKFYELMALMDTKNQWHIWSEGTVDMKAKETRDQVERTIKQYQCEVERLIEKCASPELTNELVEWILPVDGDRNDEVARELRRLVEQDRLRGLCIELKESWQSGLHCFLEASVGFH